jgi:hypothetical protein
LGFGFVFALLQATAGMFLHSSLAKTQNSSLPHGYSFSSNAPGDTNFPMNMENEFMKRGYLLPDGCKDLGDVLKVKGQKPLPWRSVKPSPEMLKKWDALKTFLASATKVPVQGVLMISKRTSITQLAVMLNLKPLQIVEELSKLGFSLSPNNEVSFETAALIVRNHGFLAKRTDDPS